MIDAPTELFIVGIGELARLAHDAAVAGKIRVAEFLSEHDRTASAQAIWGAPIYDMAERHWRTGATPEMFLVAVRDNASRCAATLHVVERGGSLTSIVHPFANCGHNSRIGNGVLICAGATIDPEVVIGDGTVIGSRVLICHETHVGRFTYIEPGAVIGGCCDIGADCIIGAGAVILSNIKIGSGTIIGPRTIVTKNLPDDANVIGVPARVARQPRIPDGH